MNNSITRFSLNIQETASQSFIAVKKGDTARVLEITLTDGGKPYEIQSDCAAVFSATKPDGSLIYNACTIENNKIVYQLTEQTVSLVGTMPVEIKLYGGDGGLITSPCFLMIVEGVVYASDDDIESTAEFSALTQAMSRIEAVIDELEGYDQRLADAEGAIDSVDEEVDEIQTTMVKSVNGNLPDASGNVYVKAEKGDTGDSAYDVAVAQGFEGTEAEWIASLKGKTGATGKSAYESAVEGGYKGTEEEFAEQMALVASVVAYNGETEDLTEGDTV